jgi:hypothetical protein
VAALVALAEICEQADGHRGITDRFPRPAPTLLELLRRDLQCLGQLLFGGDPQCHAQVQPQIIELGIGEKGTAQLHQPVGIEPDPQLAHPVVVLAGRERGELAHLVGLGLPRPDDVYRGAPGDGEQPGAYVLDVGRAIIQGPEECLTDGVLGVREVSYDRQEPPDHRWPVLDIRGQDLVPAGPPEIFVLVHALHDGRAPCPGDIFRRDRSVR